MLPRIVRIPLRYQYSAVSKPQFSNVPQVMNQTQKELQQVNELSQENTTANFADNAINFQEQVNGKRLILQSLPQTKLLFNVPQISTALFSIGTAYGLLTNFNYLFTLAFGVAAIASVFANGGLARARYGKMITAIQIDNDQRLHIDYLTRSRTDTLIVDKKNFTFNLVKCGGVATDAIWCRVNNEEFWIPKSNLQINNQQHHHLL